MIQMVLIISKRHLCIKLETKLGKLVQNFNKNSTNYIKLKLNYPNGEVFNKFLKHNVIKHNIFYVVDIACFKIG